MLEDVRTLHEKFGLGIVAAPQLDAAAQPVRERIEFMYEELVEFEEAYAKGDLAGMADALVDLTVVVLGTALQLGLYRVWYRLWADVCRANLAKERGVGKRRHNVDLIKPDGWLPPQTETILEEGGWIR